MVLGNHMYRNHKLLFVEVNMILSIHLSNLKNVLCFKHLFRLVSYYINFVLQIFGRNMKNKKLLNGLNVITAIKNAVSIQKS